MGTISLHKASSVCRAVFALLTMLAVVALAATVAPGHAATASGGPGVRVSIQTKSQAALLTTQRVNLEIRSPAGTTVRVKAGFQGKTNGFGKRRLKFNRTRSKKVSLLLNRRGRKELSTCGAKPITVSVSFKQDGRRRTEVARKRLEKSPRQCPVRPRPPVARDDNPLTDEGTARYVEVLDNDVSQDGSELSIVSVDDSATTGSVKIAGSRVRYDPAGAFETLAQGQTGSDSFVYKVQDGRGKTATATVSVEIEGLDDPSSITATPALYPDYSPEISDYVTRCDGDPVELEVDAGPGNTVDIDGQGATGGDYTTAVGLSQNQGFSFTRSAGARQETHYVRCLPAGFPQWTYEKFGDAQQQWYMVAVAGLNIVFDGNGVPVWWFRSIAGSGDFKLLGDGTLAWSTGASENDKRYEIRSLNGELLNTLRTVGNQLDTHDIQLLANGNYLVMTYMPRTGPTDLTPYGGPEDAVVLDAELQEIEPDGSLVWSWNSQDHIGLDQTGIWWPGVVDAGDSRGTYDVVHMNSAEVTGGSIVVSMRHTNAIYKLDRNTGEILWKIGGTSTPESLTVIGDPLSPNPLGGQHDARILPDGTLTFHENGQLFDRPPRAVRYALDETAGTATLLESIADPDVPAATCCGSARRSASGSWVAAWGGLGTTEHPVSEFDPNGVRTFKLSFPGRFTYRAHPVPPGQIGAAEIRLGMETQYPR